MSFGRPKVTTSSSPTGTGERPGSDIGRREDWERQYRERSGSTRDRSLATSKRPPPYPVPGVSPTVAPEVERVEVRNDRGERFPARLVALPDGYQEAYRAAWGVATDLERVPADRLRRAGPADRSGDDPRGSRPVAGGDARADPCALGRRPSVLHVGLEADALDPRPGRPCSGGPELQARARSRARLSRRGGRRADRALGGRGHRASLRSDGDDEPWEPSFGRCSFCSDRPVVAWFEGPDLTRSVASADEVRSEEAWLACDPCQRLVEANDREALVTRALEQQGKGRPWPTDAAESRRASIRSAYQRFWAARGEP